MAIWLYDKCNYIVIPSTKKPSTEKYEFVMFDGTKDNNEYRNSKRIFLQAKNGKNDLNCQDYQEVLENDGDEMWLVSSRGKIVIDNDAFVEKTIVKMTKGLAEKELFSLSELVDFVFDEKNKTILPKKISNYLDSFEK